MSARIPISEKELTYGKEDEDQLRVGLGLHVCSSSSILKTGLDTAEGSSGVGVVRNDSRLSVVDGAV